MFDPTNMSRHRWQAMLNGVVIGIGIFSVLIGGPLGILFIGVGAGMEYWHRKRLKRQE